MSKIIVTGAGGFVGTHLVKYLKDLDNRHTIFEITRQTGDITKQSTWDNLPVADVVIHLAARSFVPDSWIDVSGFMSCNVSGVLEALKYCKTHGSRLIYISSYLYGAPVSLPISEEVELSVNNPYALTKKFAEETCRFYAESFGVQVTILRPFNVYGPGQSTLFLIPSLVKQATEGLSIHVKDLEPKRDYLFVSDLVTAIGKAIDYRKGYDVFNIGSGVSYSVKELIDIIQKNAGTNLPVFSDAERRKNEVMDTIANIAKAKALLDWQPQWSLSDGTKEILEKFGQTGKL